MQFLYYKDALFSNFTKLQQKSTKLQRRLTTRCHWYNRYNLSYVWLYSKI